MFITLEGPEGSGKTSHVPSLVEHLKEQGHAVFPTREPGGTSIGEQIRVVIHDLKNVEMHPRAETLLYQAARAQIVEQVIRPRLAAGEIVISDRYADSTIAYQGYGHQQDLEQVRALVRYATGGLVPDLTILLDLDVEVGLQRKTQDGSEWNRLDAYTVDFHKRVRAGYLEMVKAEPQTWVVIDAGAGVGARAGGAAGSDPRQALLPDRRCECLSSVCGEMARHAAASDILNTSSTGLGDASAEVVLRLVLRPLCGAALGEEWNPSCTSAICRIRPRRTTCAPCSPRPAR